MNKEQLLQLRNELDLGMRLLQEQQQRVYTQIQQQIGAIEFANELLRRMEVTSEQTADSNQQVAGNSDSVTAAGAGDESAGAVAE